MTSPQPSLRPELAVGAVVIVDDRLLLVERGRGAGAGMWSIPGGRVEWGETMAVAVIRELREETGLAGRVVRHLGFVERIADAGHYVIHDFLVDVTPPDGGTDIEALAAAGDDASAVAWWPIESLAAHPALVPGLIEFLDDCEMVGPSRASSD